MKAEGKLSAEQNSTPLHDEAFASSVDSHGFHHAERPDDDLNGSPEEIKKLEVQNASDEDGFEKVAVPDAEALPDEVTFDDFNKRLDDTVPSPLVKSGDPASTHHVPVDMDVEQAVTPTEQAHPGTMDDSPPTPTGLPRQVGELQLGSPEQTSDEPQSEGKRRVSLLTQQLQQQIQESELNTSSDQTQTSENEEQDVDMLSHPEDKPAPLFSSNASSSQSGDDDESDSPSRSTATLQPNTALPAGANEDGRLWEADLDGSPVVGDLLKIMFVEHQVVPTILVRILRHTFVPNLFLLRFFSAGLFLSLSLE